MFQCQFHRRLEHADGRVADDDVHAVEFLAENLKRFLEAFGIADVGLNRERFPAKFANCFANRLGFLVAVVVSDGHVAARTREFQRGGATNAPGTAGDECDFS